MLRGAYQVWLAQAAGTAPPVPPDDLVEATIAMENPHFLAATETVIRTWLDAGRQDLAAAMAGSIAENAAAESDGSPLLHASAALIDAWVTGSRTSAKRAAQLAASVPAPWWEARARAAGA
jgi:hypothetical protein